MNYVVFLGGNMLRLLYTVIAAALAALAAPALAQEPAPVPPPAPPSTFWTGWSATLENKVAPALGEPISDAFTDDYVDQSEYEVALAIRRPLDFAWGIQLELRGGVTAQPHLSDDGTQESSYYGQVTLGDTYLPLGRIIRDGELQRATDIDDAVRAYGRYRFASIHDGLLEDHTRNEHQVTGGFRRRDIRWVRCTRGRTSESPYPCGDVPGWSWEVRAELTYLWSTDASKGRIFPMLRGDVVSGPFGRDVSSGPFWRDVRAVAAVMGEWSFFQNERVGPQNELRRDFRLRIQGGLDISGPVRRLFAVSKGISVEILGRFQRNWSDRGDKEHSRFYFVPTVTFSTNF